jgi:hypothetical protein
MKPRKARPDARILWCVVVVCVVRVVRVVAKPTQLMLGFSPVERIVM